MFHVAAMSGRVQILKKLINVIGTLDFINSPDKRRMRPIHYAVLMGNFYIVQELINTNAKKRGP